MRIYCSILILCLTFISPLAADGAPDPLSIDVSNCNEQPKTPACASWVLTLCEWRRNLDLCRKVGITDVVFLHPIPLINGKPDVPQSFMGRIMFGFPTLREIVRGASKTGEVRRPGVVTIDFEHGDEGSKNQILGVRQVTVDRFEPGRKSLTTKQTFEELIGTHEVMIGMYMTKSQFFRKEGERWVLASWTVEGAGCGYHDPYALADAMCQKNIPVQTWDFHLPWETVLTLKRHEWQANDYIRYFQRPPKQ